MQKKSKQRGLTFILQVLLGIVSSTISDSNLHVTSQSPLLQRIHHCALFYVNIKACENKLKRKLLKNSDM